MRLNRLDLNLLVALDALLTERSITRAADRIHLSQPATSGALARLREFFGDELLVRVGAQMQPTPLGESLATPVHNILLQIQSTVDRGLDFEPSKSDRKFKIMCNDYTASTIINPLVAHLNEVAPNIQLDIWVPFSQPKDHLEKGEVDFLIMPLHVLSEENPHVVLFDQDFMCIGWEQNPIFDKPLTDEVFLNAKHAAVRMGPDRERSQDQILLERHLGIVPNIEITTSFFSSLPPMLVNTNRIATCYSNLAKRWIDILPLKAAPFPYDLPSVTWGLQWHKLRELDPGIQWMRSQMSMVAKQID